ncbi:MAG: leucine-rich repeat protein [Clostridia bacterium]
MNKTLKKVISLCLSLMMLMTMTAISFTADATDIYLSYAVNYTTGYAEVSDCETYATGGVTVPASTIIDGVTYLVKSIGKDAFADCTEITAIIIEEGITTIESGAFSNCTSLISITMPTTIETCAADAFDGCSGYTINCYDSNMLNFLLFASNGATLSVSEETPMEQVMGIFETISSYLETIAAYISEIFQIDFSFDSFFGLV